MAIFKTIDFEEILNVYNLPAGGIDRFGYPVKQLMIELESNELYILDENNNIIPLSSKYASVQQLEQLKKKVRSVLRYKGYLSGVGDVNELIQYLSNSSLPEPKADNGDVYTLSTHNEFVCIGTSSTWMYPSAWQDLGNATSDISGYLSAHYLGKGSTIKELTGYIDITQWNKLATACTSGINTAIDTLVNKYQTNNYFDKFSEFINYCEQLSSQISEAGISCTSANVSAALDMIIYAASNKTYSAFGTFINTVIQHTSDINYLSSQIDLISTALSTGLTPVVSAQVASLVSSYAPSKQEFNTLSSNYTDFVSQVATKDQQVQESLSALQSGLEEVNKGLNTVISGLKFN